MKTLPRIPRVVPLALLAAAAAFLACADEITVDGETFEDVYVAETGSRWHVYCPDSGAVRSFPKDAVPEDAVRVTADPAERNRLRQSWLDKTTDEKEVYRTKTRAGVPEPEKETARPSFSENKPEERAQPVGPEEPSPLTEEQPNERDGLGYIGPPEFENVPLGTALRAILRSKNLDYRIIGNVVWVSRPDLLRNEPMSELDHRVYPLGSLNDGGALPKIVVGNPGGMR